MTPPTHIIIHHSLTKDSKTVSWGAIRKYHVDALGFDEIGYRYGIELARDSIEIFVGRFDTEDYGAHCPEMGMNDRSIGVCIIGNFDVAPPSIEIFDKAARFIAYLCRIHEIPTFHVLGHNQCNPNKSCPGKHFDMELFRKEVTKHL